MKLFKFIRKFFPKKKEKTKSLQNDPYIKDEFNFVEVKKEKTTKHLTEGVDYNVYD